MSEKPVSLTPEAYERLRTARRWPGESLSAVVLRAGWPEDTTTARQILDLRGTRTRSFTDEELDRIDALKRSEIAADMGRGRG
jgi:hypothetical protein